MQTGRDRGALGDTGGGARGDLEAHQCFHYMAKAPPHRKQAVAPRYLPRIRGPVVPAPWTCSTGHAQKQSKLGSILFLQGTDSGI